MELTVFDIADWFLNKSEMTHKKLQKMVYYAYSWYIYLYNDDIDKLDNRLFNGNFQAWIHGPINVELRDKYKDYKIFDVIPKVEDIDNEKYEIYQEFLEQVFDAYNPYSGDVLEVQTHSESPWKNARKNLKPWESSTNVIDVVDMFKEYAIKNEQMEFDY